MISHEIDAGSLYVALKSGQNRKRNRITEAMSKAFGWLSFGLLYVVLYVLNKILPDKPLL